MAILLLLVIGPNIISRARVSRVSRVMLVRDHIIILEIC